MTKKNIITLCSKTINHFKKILIKNEKKHVLIGIKGGGCNGFKYYIEPTNKEPDKIDEKVNINDLSVYVCGKSLFHLIGTEIKWKDDFMGSGLEFNNPNASSSCGCGETFSL